MKIGIHNFNGTKQEVKEFLKKEMDIRSEKIKEIGMNYICEIEKKEEKKIERKKKIMRYKDMEVSIEVIEKKDKRIEEIAKEIIEKWYDGRKGIIDISRLKEKIKEIGSQREVDEIFIKRIMKSISDKNSMIKYICLSGNKIKSIQIINNINKIYPIIKGIDISNNEIEKIEEINIRIEEIDLRNNPIKGRNNQEEIQKIIPNIIIINGNKIENKIKFGIQKNYLEEEITMGYFSKYSTFKNIKEILREIFDKETNKININSYYNQIHFISITLSPNCPIINQFIHNINRNHLKEKEIIQLIGKLLNYNLYYSKIILLNNIEYNMMEIAFDIIEIGQIKEISVFGILHFNNQPINFTRTLLIINHKICNDHIHLFNNAIQQISVNITKNCLSALINTASRGRIPHDIALSVLRSVNFDMKNALLLIRKNVLHQNHPNLNCDHLSSPFLNLPSFSSYY
ncbi:hypothetical protein EDI_125330 [Entamoeba dispar SAW760]|uniref:Uncharacterized protein n=1 Tax=Entamoeba dispar (strain ATCC PRA-260 / SAW760) TaxID=370354 RepID=B0EC38_ENTDS|nr:uncharacterized protein EDI_125120 [Entamoeba dispar SAW760]XP_001735885.1 uncharacterized protein EDI_125330 [Entamoeba dispar SAW760]EDR27886.1 hypothetical protein EDI_125120 [Entamoeba dispar SAW760]EDR27897.1 hypothetical protein EDI_125330 [Entamoeba dispar SAW760]|eukprot:EDR27886.1 hypothetical protein EDI_125120 [Entamoeba dispar SAW760]